ncbi:hypothetical protein LTR17_018666 [Elasticomyces elasticus]|nr:hypothetical protein LTR17_018666 [Elasticomyces elasticus]
MAYGRISHDAEARYRMNALAVEGADDCHYAYDQSISSPDLGPAAPAFDDQSDPFAFEAFDTGYVEHPEHEEEATEYLPAENNHVYQQPEQEQIDYTHMTGDTSGDNTTQYRDDTQVPATFDFDPSDDLVETQPQPYNHNHPEAWSIPDQSQGLDTMAQPSKLLGDSQWTRHTKTFNMAPPSYEGADDNNYGTQYMQQPYPTTTTVSGRQASGGIMGDVVPEEETGDYSVGDEFGTGHGDEGSQTYQGHAHQHRESASLPLGLDMDSEAGDFEDDESDDDEVEDGEAAVESLAYSGSKAAVDVQRPRKRAAHAAREVITRESDAENGSDDSPAPSSDDGKHWVVKKSRSGRVVRFEVPYPAPHGKTWVAPAATGPRKDKPWLRSDSANGALDSVEAPQANSSLQPNVPLTGAELCMIFVNHNWPPILKRLRDAGYTTKEIAAAQLHSYDMATPDEITQRDRAIRKQIKHTLDLPVATDFGTASFKQHTDRRPPQVDLLTRYGDNMGYFPPAEEHGSMTKGIQYALDNPELRLTVNDLGRLAKEQNWVFPYDSTKAPAEADAAGRIQVLKMMEEDGVHLSQKGCK